jgi:hypothetical protein
VNRTVTVVDAALAVAAGGAPRPPGQTNPVEEMTAAEALRTLAEEVRRLRTAVNGAVDDW